jgi:transporter family-2 protein
MNWFAIMLTSIAGAMLPVQGAINARLGRELNSPVLATLSSFVTGTIAVLFYVLIVRVGTPCYGELLKIPVWAWTGGLIGALYVGVMVWSVPKLGTATAFGIAIAGQILLSALLDHFGVLGLRPHPLSIMRSVGIALLMSGVVLVQRG